MRSAHITKECLADDKGVLHIYDDDDDGNDGNDDDDDDDDDNDDDRKATPAGVSC